MDNQFKIKNLPNPSGEKEAVLKSYVQDKLNDSSEGGISVHVDFNYKNLTNVRFVRVNAHYAVGGHLTPIIYVDQSVDEDILERIKKNNDFQNNCPSKVSHFSLNSEPTDDNHAATKSYVDSLSENNRNRRDLSTVIKDRFNEFDMITLTNSDSFTLSRNPLLKEDATYERNIVDGIHKNTIFRINKTLQKYLKDSAKHLFIILRNMIEKNLEIKILLKLATLVDIYCNNGIQNIIIKTTVEKEKVLKELKH